MSSNQRGPFLDRLTYDVRLAIYTYVVLPPFSGCRDYLGLPLSCRQTYNEIDQEGTRQLRMFLNDTRRTGIVKLNSDDSVQDVKQSSIQMDCCLDLQVKEPTSVLRPVVVFLEVPFILPPVEHDWYLQPPLRTLRTNSDGNSHHIIHRPRTQMPQGDIDSSQDATQSYQGRICSRRNATQQPPPHIWHLPTTVRHHPASHITQQQKYAMRIKELLRPIEALHRLHAEIRIQLTADEETVARISQEIVRYSNPGLETGSTLDSTALGWLLEMYMDHLKQRCLRNIGARRRNWAFHTRAIEITWDLTSPCPIWPMSKLPQSHWAPHTASNTRFGSQDCHECRLLCTDDCREGTIRFRFDVKKAIQTQLDHVEKTLREMKPEQRRPVGAYIERLEYDIFYDREKLSVLGVPGYEQSGSQEEREESLNESWKKRREAAESSTAGGC